MTDEFTVIQDTREQTPWDFGFYGINQIRQKLDTGDYSLVGYTDIVCIERKKSTGELAINLGSGKARFIRELERLAVFPYKYLVLEFSEAMLERFPADSGIPASKRRKMRMNAGFMKSCLEKIKSFYDIDVIFAGNRNNAIDEAYHIFQKVKATNGENKPIF